MGVQRRWTCVVSAVALAACGAPAPDGGGTVFRVRAGAMTLTVECGGRPVAVYQVRDREVPGHPLQNRCGYFPALYAPSGRLLTEDGPADHLHHRGLFLAWTRVSWSPEPVKGWEKTANFWELAEASGRRGPGAVSGVREGPEGASFTVRHDWRIGETVILRETLTIRVTAPGPDAHQMDLDFILAPAGGAVELSERAHHEAYPHFYSALGLRAAAAFPPERLVFTYADGRDHNAVENGRFEGEWLSVSGPLEGRPCGVALAWHPKNPPARLNHWRNLRFINADLAATGSVRIEAGRTLRLRFRVLAHDGDAAGARVEERMRW